MLQKSTLLVLAVLLQGISCPPASAAEREDVRKVANLVTSVKMPYPESLTRNRARTERVWLERGGTTTGCIGLEERRWCYEYIPPEGNRPEMLRIGNEPLRGVYIGALCYYVDDFDLDGLLDVGSTTEKHGASAEKSHIWQRPSKMSSQRRKRAGRQFRSAGQQSARRRQGAACGLTRGTLAGLVRNGLSASRRRIIEAGANRGLIERDPSGNKLQREASRSAGRDS
jgi:hypothetical protein